MLKKDCVIGLKVKVKRPPSPGRRNNKSEFYNGKIIGIYDKYILVSVEVGNGNNHYNETFDASDLIPIP